MSEKPPYPAGQYPPQEPPPPYPSGPYPTNQGGPQIPPAAPYPPMSGPPPVSQTYYVPPTNVYYPPTSTTTTTVIVAAPGFGLGPNPVNTQCPNCHAQVLTETRPQPGTLAWLICICCILFGFVFGCCLIPFCIDDLQDVEHRCPQCKHYLGTYRRL